MITSLILALLIQVVSASGSGSVSTSGSASSTVQSRQWIFLMGDSVTCCYNWPILMQQSVYPQPWTVANAAVTGRSVASTVTNLAATLATTNITDIPIVLINLGVNDFVAPTFNDPGYDTTWIANYQTIIDALRVKWPACPIYITKPWSRGNDSKADLMSGWINTVVASRTLVYVGTDERGFYKGNDDGVTNTVDGIHPSVAGNIAIAAAQKVILWP